jgi:hypothetical protein
VSQHYHGISSKTLEYNVFLLDMIETRTPKFAEVMAATLKFRIDHWTERFPDIVCAGGVA